MIEFGTATEGMISICPPTMIAVFRVALFTRSAAIWSLVLGAAARLSPATASMKTISVFYTRICPESYPNGRFARLSDPEGNPIELWEPKVDS